MKNNSIKEKLTLYFLLGSQDVESPEKALTLLEGALKAGISLFQFREKGEGSTLGSQEYISFARKCQALCQRYHTPFIVNDDVRLALILNADGVHVGQNDGNLEGIREKIGAKKILGVSCHSIEEITQAIIIGANYAGVGPVFSTSSKADAQSPRGVLWLENLRKQHPDFPLVAIGGINLASIPAIFAAGIDGVAVISAITQDLTFIKKFWQII